MCPCPTRAGGSSTAHTLHVSLCPVASQIPPNCTTQEELIQHRAASPPELRAKGAQGAQTAQSAGSGAGSCPHSPAMAGSREGAAPEALLCFAAAEGTQRSPAPILAPTAAAPRGREQRPGSHAQHRVASLLPWDSPAPRGAAPKQTHLFLGSACSRRVQREER